MYRLWPRAGGVMDVKAQVFRLAKMSSMIRALTIALILLPLVFFASVALGNRLLLTPAVLLVLIYAWIWLRFRPSSFVVFPDTLEVIWPLKCRRIPREDIASVRLINKEELLRQAGKGMRVGAGGLWGGFGWLWSDKRGIVQMYVSRADGLVWIERVSNRPWLITPEDPENFVRALSR